MRHLILLLSAPALLLGGLMSSEAHASELTWKDLNSGARPVPVEKRVTPVAKNIYVPREEMRVSLDILVDGKPSRVISHNGKLYLPVPRMGAEYEIRIQQYGQRRLEAVVSVDGLSVIKGDPASERSPGYLVDPRGNIVIKGWRRDRNTVAAFTFEEPKNSYAYTRGYRDNIGVIGLVAIEEQAYTLPQPLTQFYSGATPLSKARDERLGGTGTGWGRDISSDVTEVPFVRSANKRTVTIYYDTEEALRRMGVLVDAPFPRPFPADTQFCPPPSGSR